MNSIQSRLVRLIALLLVAMMAFSMSACDLILPFINGEGNEQGGDEDIQGDVSCKHESITSGRCNICGEICPITIKEALALCDAYPDGTTERYYIRANVKTLSNSTYGEMTIEDATGEIYVYGTYSSDGTLRFDAIGSTPVKGDEVLLHCILSIYNGTKQVKNARLIEFKSNAGNANVSEYTKMSIAEARIAATDSLVRVKGVVARIAYANGQKPSGVILVDSTSSIYIHDQDLAGQVEIGNTVEVAASKTYWILDSEINNANKFGYKGANQLEKATVISVDKTVSDFDKTWITESTIKTILETPVTEDITNKIFKVDALVKKQVGTGFVNYCFDDIDGVTGSYTYTQCNGSDFGWLDKFDGKICTVYIVAINAKSTTSGCVWRFLPIEVIDEGYQFDVKNAPEYAVIYHGLTQFLESYSGDPAKELVTSVSSELLGFENATLSYSSDNSDIVSFVEENGVVTMHCGKAGTAKITVSAAYGESTYSASISINVVENADIEYVSVAEAISAANNTTVTVKGIVGPSLVNKVGFYLVDESGIIPVQVDATVMDTLEIGYEVIISGTRTVTKDGDGQICIDGGSVVTNNYGSHSYSTASFITGKTIPEICSVSDSAEATTNVYVTSAEIHVNATTYSVTVQLRDPDGSTTYLLLYSGGKDQYKWLEGYDGQVVTVEVALCDWNAKGLKGCVLAVVNEDGTKVINALNFN